MPAWMLAAVAVAVAALAFGAYALVGWSDESEPRRASRPQPVASKAAGEPAAPEPDQRTRPKVSRHVTFGAHTRARGPCETCHPNEPTEGIVCRTCHGDVCGKDSKTVSDCLKCHKTGTTDSWVPIER